MEDNSAQQQTQIPSPAPLIPKDPIPSHPLPRHIPKKPALIILIALVVIFLAGGAYGIYNLGKNSITPTPLPIPTPTVSENTLTPTTDPTTDNSKITFETFQKIKFYMDAPSGSKVDGENITVNGSTFNVVSAGGRDGPCGYEDYGKSCTAEDIEVPSLPTELKINTLRIWKENGAVFMINPQSIYINDEFMTDALLITKLSPNKFFTPEETSVWINLLKTINNQ